MHPVPINEKNKIILALDVPGAEEARDLIRRVGARVGLYKVGLQLFTRCGPDIVKEIRDAGAGVFLDLKFFDIPNTVRHAVESAVALGAEMLTVHLGGGPGMLAAAAQAAQGSDTLVLGVTVLTSWDDATLAAVGCHGSVEDQVVRLARLGGECGIRGLVCSPREITPLRETLGASPILVTPGIRPAWAGADDQKRMLAPAEAVAAGANYLVIGRPITAHADPAAAAQRILDELS